MRKIHKGDEVIVIAGKNKGKIGQVLKVFVENNKVEQVTVEGVNIVKKHAKPNPVKGITGGVINKTMPIDISNIAIYNDKTKKADRVGIKFKDDGAKVRIFKSNNEEIG